MLYVHPAAAGQGVGAMLVDALEKLAGARGAKKLRADVSDTAQDFFKKRGFAPYRRNTVQRGGEWLVQHHDGRRTLAPTRAVASPADATS